MEEGKASKQINVQDNNPEEAQTNWFDSTELKAIEVRSLRETVRLFPQTKWSNKAASDQLRARHSKQRDGTEAEHKLRRNPFAVFKNTKKGRLC